jgi:protein O-GlcNAc transferase
MELIELLRRYEADGSEETYLEARGRYEAALAADPRSAKLQHEYGYLRECHARNELRTAASHYERAVELEPAWVKPRFQLLIVRAALLEIQDAIRGYRETVAAYPDELTGYRLLASAYVLAREGDKAEETAIAGLRLAADDPVLTRTCGEAAALLGRVDDALALWRRAVDLDPDDLGAAYSAAFLLEQEGRAAEAAREWRRIAEWCVARGYDIEAEWPKREIARLEGSSQPR